MQYSTTRYVPLAFRLSLGDTQCQVLIEFSIQTVLNMTRSDILTLLSVEWRVVDGKEHTHGRLIYGDRRKSLWILEIADGIAYLKSI